MRHRFHHLTAIALLLSVMLSMLGTTHVSCEAMEPVSGAGDHVRGGTVRVGEEPDSSEAGHCELADENPVDRGQAPDACGLVAHCVAPMLVSERVVDDAVRPTSSSRIAADDTPPLELTAAPDSPPPRA